MAALLKPGLFPALLTAEPVG